MVFTSLPTRIQNAAPAASEAPTTTVAAAAAASVPAGASNLSAANGDIFYQAVGAGSFLTLAKLLNQADLMDTIKSKGPFTVFAPTDAAFAAVPADALAAIAADKAKLTKVLLYHVVPGRISSTDLKTGDTKTAEGSALKITATAGVVTVNGAKVIAANVGASNGVIHVIDKVLLPPDL